MILYKRLSSHVNLAWRIQDLPRIKLTKFYLSEVWPECQRFKKSLRISSVKLQTRELTQMKPSLLVLQFKEPFLLVKLRISYCLMLPLFPWVSRLLEELWLNSSKETQPSQQRNLKFSQLLPITKLRSALKFTKVKEKWLLTTNILENSN